VRNIGRFLFERRVPVSVRETLGKIFAQKRNDSAQPFVLRGVNQLMGKKMSILRAIAPDKDAVVKS